LGRRRALAWQKGIVGLLYLTQRALPAPFAHVPELKSPRVRSDRAS